MICEAVVQTVHANATDGQALLNSSVKTDLFCGSPTKGDMELVMGTTWTFIEYDLPQFEWVPGMFAITNDLEM